MDNLSLDDLLKQIEEETMDVKIESTGGESVIPKTSSGMKEIGVHEEEMPTASPSPLNVDINASSIPQISRHYLGTGPVVSDNMQQPGGESSRQSSLPKLSYRMLGSLAAVLVLVAGLGTALVLSQQPQDLRQYASEQSGRIDPELEPYLADGKTVQDLGSEQTGETSEAVVMDNQPNKYIWWQSPLIIAGAAVLISGLLITLVFLHWLFAV